MASMSTQFSFPLCRSVYTVRTFLPTWGSISHLRVNGITEIIYSCFQSCSHSLRILLLRRNIFHPSFFRSWTCAQIISTNVFISDQLYRTSWSWDIHSSSATARVYRSVTGRVRYLACDGDQELRMSAGLILSCNLDIRRRKLSPCDFTCRYPPMCRSSFLPNMYNVLILKFFFFHSLKKKKKFLRCTTPVESRTPK